MCVCDNFLWINAMITTANTCSALRLLLVLNCSFKHPPPTSLPSLIDRYTLEKMRAQFLHHCVNDQVYGLEILARLRRKEISARNNLGYTSHCGIVVNA